MKSLRPLRLLLLLLLPLTLFHRGVPAARGQTFPTATTSAVTKTTATNNITGDLDFGTGRTLLFESGSTLSLLGTLSGTPTGGTLNLSALTLTLPATVSSAANLALGAGSSGATLTLGQGATGVTTLKTGGGTITLSALGTANVSIGQSTGGTFTTGEYNAVYGYLAGAALTNGRENTFLGNNAGNAFMGNGEAVENGLNTFVGSFAGAYMTSGLANTFIGQKAGLHSNGGSNIAIGAHAGTSNVAGSSNIYIGNASGDSGGVVADGGSYNVFIGEGVNSGISGINTANVAVGRYAARTMSAAINNTLLGYGAMETITTGGSNVAVGAAAGGAVTTGSNNVFIGKDANGTASGTTNAIAIGQGVTAASDTIAIGNASHTATTLKGTVTTGGGYVSTVTGVPQLTFGSNATTQLTGFLYSSQGRYLQISANRNPISGVLVNTSGTHAEISFDTGSADGNITFRTSATNNTIGTEALKINKNQGLEVKGTTASTSTTTGALIVSGGAGIAGNVIAGGVVRPAPYTVAGLPSAASYAGALAYVTDASATTRLATVTGGGANKVIVYSDGTNWLIL